jgi:hypothetical protein
MFLSFLRGLQCPQPDFKYCCLGVLCEQAVKAGVITACFMTLASGRVIKRYEEYSGHGHQMLLPPKVARWAGLLSIDPTVSITGDATESLTGCNDARKDGFAAIAGYVRCQRTGQRKE